MWIKIPQELYAIKCVIPRPYEFSTSDQLQGTVRHPDFSGMTFDPYLQERDYDPEEGLRKIKSIFGESETGWTRLK